MLPSSVHILIFSDVTDSHYLKHRLAVLQSYVHNYIFDFGALTFLHLKSILILTVLLQLNILLLYSRHS